MCFPAPDRGCGRIGFNKLGGFENRPLTTIFEVTYRWINPARELEGGMHSHEISEAIHFYRRRSGFVYSTQQSDRAQRDQRHPSAPKFLPWAQSRTIRNSGDHLHTDGPHCVLRFESGILSRIAAGNDIACRTLEMDAGAAPSSRRFSGRTAISIRSFRPTDRGCISRPRDRERVSKGDLDIWFVGGSNPNGVRLFISIRR